MAECNILLNCFLFVSFVIFVWVQTSAALCDESLLRNNHSPLHFHHVHGKYIKLTNDKRVASRQNSRSEYNNGIVFSSRTVNICEPVYVKLLETSNFWYGTVAIGFTMNDPESFESKLPEDVTYSDFLPRDGNWAKEFDPTLVKKASVIHYYVDQNGDVRYGIDGEEYGIFFGGVNTTGRLWAVIDVYGRTVAVEFTEYNHVDISTDTSFEATTDWYSTETVEYIISTAIETTTEEEILTMAFTDGYFDKPGSLRSYTNAESAVLPCSKSEPARETSPFLNTPRDLIYSPVSPRDYDDISINFPLPYRQSRPAPDTPHLVHPGPTRNYLKNKPPSAKTGWGNERFLEILGVILRDSERFSIDTQDRSFRKADEELSLEHADASHSQNNDTPLMALFLIPNSYSANIRVNDKRLG